MRFQEAELFNAMCGFGVIQQATLHVQATSERGWKEKEEDD